MAETGCWRHTRQALLDDRDGTSPHGALWPKSILLMPAINCRSSIRDFFYSIEKGRTVILKGRHEHTQPYKGANQLQPVQWRSCSHRFYRVLQDTAIFRIMERYDSDTSPDKTILSWFSVARVFLIWVEIKYIMSRNSKDAYVMERNSFISNSTMKICILGQHGEP